MTELKTRPTRASVDKFLKSVEDETKQADCRTLVEIMQRVTGAKPVMWGPSIVGFGSYHFRYASGREGDWMLAGFSPRKRDLTVYVMAGFKKAEKTLAKLGKHRASSGGCLYLKRLSDIDLNQLETLIRDSVEHLRRVHPDPD